MHPERQVSELQQERQDTHLRRDLIVQIARRHLQGTALVEDKPFTPEDTVHVKEFLLAAAPFAHPKVNPTYWEHLVIASVYARKIAERAPSLGLDPNEAEALLLLHDLGRLAIAHRYLRNDVVEHSIFTGVGIREEELNKLASVPRIIGVKVPFVSSVKYAGIDDVPPLQRALDVADNIGKRGSDGNLFDIRSMVTYDNTQPSRYTGGMWPSERVGRRALTEHNKQKFATDLLLEEFQWLKDKYNTDFDTLRGEVSHELEKSEHKAFLLALKDAQETLDPKVDEVLSRPPIEAVVFDVGDVLFQGEGEPLDNELVRRLSTFFNIPEKETLQVFSRLHKEGMTGQMSQREYLEQFWALAGKQPPTDIVELNAPFLHPDIYQPNPKLQELCAALSRNPKIKLFIFSNVVPALSRTMPARLRECYPEFQTPNILLSCERGVAKGVNNEAAFSNLCQAINREPQSILFIDDNGEYTSAARGLFGIRGFTFRGNPYTDVSAETRLSQELERGGLI